MQIPAVWVIKRTGHKIRNGEESLSKRQEDVSMDRRKGEFPGTRGREGISGSLLSQAPESDDSGHHHTLLELSTARGAGDLVTSGSTISSGRWHGNRRS